MNILRESLNPMASAEAALAPQQVSRIMQGIHARGDRIMTMMIIGHAIIALALASFYSTWLITLTIGASAVALFLISRALLPGTLTTRCLAGVSLQIFVMLHIYQLHGLDEMHFFFFTALTMMIVYQDWLCLWPGALLLIAQHTLFALLTNAGEQLFFFQDTYIGMTKLAFHFGIALSQVFICSGWAYMLRKRTLQEIGMARRDEQTEQLRQSLVLAERRADRDPLTDLFNHRVFHQRLEEEAERAARDGTLFAIAVLDMDNFKFFNDAYGHQAGDAVLRQAAKALAEACGPCDCLARYGGDEFAILAPGVGPRGEQGWSERLRASLSRCGYTPPGESVTIPLEVSLGMAFFPQDGLLRLEVLEMADKRLRRIKTGGDGTELEHLRSNLTNSVSGFTLLDALVTAVDNKDRYTARHSDGVLIYSVAIGRALGLNDDTLQTLKVAALLHDVGKIGVPDAILRKPGRLSDEEYEAIKHHPLMGSIIVGSVPGFDGTLDAIRHHHERWDGAGYPFALAGEEIPLLARIMAVADAYSAMTTDRPYRKGMQAERAFAILEDGAGAQWDPCCVAAFVRTQRELLDAVHACNAAQRALQEGQMTQRDSVPEPQSGEAWHRLTPLPVQ